MKINALFTRWTAASLILFSLTARAGAELENLPTGGKVLDPDVIFSERPDPTISPNGQWVAYLSKGIVCVTNIKKPAPQQLFEVPNSRSHILARPEYVHAHGDSGALARAVGQEAYKEVSSKITKHVHELVWIHNSDGVVFGVQSYDPDGKNPTYDMWHVSFDGAKKRLSHVGPEALTIAIGHGILTRDRRFLVAQGYPRALIWNVATNKPRATPFLNLTPSPTSGRWIGIEKDTRQLVIVDEDFKVTKRFDQTRPAKSYGFKLDWSPDERYIICRNQVGFDYYSNWEGFWMNLDSGEKRDLSGRFMEEQFGFTGRGGEFFRCGQDGKQAGWSGDQITGAHLTIVPEGDGPPRDVWRIEVDRKGPVPGALTNQPSNPPLRPAPNCDLFAIGLPRRAGEKSGWVWHLIDRAGNTWQFPGEDNGQFISPFEVVGFAEGGKQIIAHDTKRLFSIPASTIKSDTK